MPRGNKANPDGGHGAVVLSWVSGRASSWRRSWSRSQRMCPPAVRTAGFVTPAAAQRVSVLRSIPRARAAAPVVTSRCSGVSLMDAWSHSRCPDSNRYTECSACNVRNAALLSHRSHGLQRSSGEVDDMPKRNLGQVRSGVSVVLLGAR